MDILGFNSPGGVVEANNRNILNKVKEQIEEGESGVFDIFSFYSRS